MSSQSQSENPTHRPFACLREMINAEGSKGIETGVDGVRRGQVNVIVAGDKTGKSRLQVKK